MQATDTCYHSPLRITSGWEQEGLECRLNLSRSPYRRSILSIGHFHKLNKRYQRYLSGDVV